MVRIVCIFQFESYNIVWQLWCYTSLWSVLFPKSDWSSE